MRMQRNELEAWLGDDWTPEQIEQIATDFGAWESENPDASEDESTAMLTAISQYHDGTLDIAEIAAADSVAQRAAAEARRALKAATIVRVRLAGVSEVVAAREAGVDRAKTLRPWLGKKR
jgi:hypothetical protein